MFVLALLWLYFLKNYKIYYEIYFGVSIKAEVQFYFFLNVYPAFMR